MFSSQLLGRSHPAKSAPSTDSDRRPVWSFAGASWDRSSSRPLRLRVRVTKAGGEVPISKTPVETRTIPTCNCKHFRPMRGCRLLVLPGRKATAHRLNSFISRLWGYMKENSSCLCLSRQVTFLPGTLFCRFAKQKIDSEWLGPVLRTNLVYILFS